MTEALLLDTNLATRRASTIPVQPTGTGSLRTLGDVAATAGIGIRPVTVIAASGATQTLAFAASGDSAYDITLTANCAITITGGTVGQCQQLTLYLRQSGAGGFAPSFTQTIGWPGGTAPTFNTTAGKFDALKINTPDGGVTLSGGY